MSSFTREKLSLHLRRRMGVFVTRVKATELIAHLPCLTPSDKEEIQAKKDFSGNYVAMQLLLDYVQKRMNWPEELMSALELLEHQDLADELRAEWNKHNQNNPYPPSAAATTAVRTPVHPIPSTISEGSPSSLVLPAQPAPPEVAAPLEVAPPEASLPLPPPVVAPQPEAPPSSVPEAPMAGSSSEPAPHAPEAAVSPEMASEAAPSPVAVLKAEPQATPLSPVSAEEPTVISEPSASSQPGPVETVSLEDNSSHSDAPTQIALSETTPTSSGSDLIPAVTQIPLPVSHLALSQTESTPAALARFQSPERRPVQDTLPHTVKVTTFHQEAVEDSDPTQVTEDVQHTELSHFSLATASASPTVDTSMNEDDVNFSKPEVLRSEVMDSQPYSGDSTRLQRSVSDLVLATDDVNSPVVVPDPFTTSTHLPCQENGVPEEINEPLSHNEPQEDTFESSWLSSLGDQEVLHNVVHVSEDASIQNNDGQSPNIVVHVSKEPRIWNQDDQTQSMLGTKNVGVSGTPRPVPNRNGQSQGLIMMVNGQDASPSTKHPDAPTGSVAVVNSSSSAENRKTVEPMGTEVPMEARAVPELKQEGTIGESYYLLGAAVVAVSLFMAWRMMN
ncbi:mitochondrial antiviral-signaling protein [Salmo trutta]|uniref:Mitochondrial antiviral-signaling protein n=1 Tax=Salmo trutta TaxID=8032 RepID=A0A674CYJ4_SALTR|nr:calphotin-like [Salmo trutta]XP_029586883.1 calphotin-like [Salmo trutta]XP_029586884.1 calphotin-like [Salmo trutta]XP_029586885.1 calphotin-like [Salmo trutta]